MFPVGGPAFKRTMLPALLSNALSYMTNHNTSINELTPPAVIGNENQY
jgi:hypothetical protein